MHLRLRNLTLLPIPPTVLYCTKLAKAQTDSEREEIEAEMRSSHELAPILAILRGDDDGGMPKIACLVYVVTPMSTTIMARSCVLRRTVLGIDSRYEC